MRDKVFDVIIIGGGASGMMAALIASKRGKRILLLEKNASLGKKLLITGGGRCNVTNNKKDIREMLAKYKGSDQFLYSAFTQHGVKDSIAFFQSNDVELHEENEGRLFPKTNKAKTIYDAIHKNLDSKNITILVNTPVLRIEKPNDVFQVHTKKEIYRSASLVIATGGTSHPETGSTGDGYSWLRNLGHTIIPNSYALVPIALHDTWVSSVAGVRLDDTKLTTFLDGKKQSSHKGKLLFTHVGISGPTVLNMSKHVGELLEYGEVAINVDMFPSLDYPDLKKKLQDILVKESNKKIKNVIGNLIPQALVTHILTLASIDGETFCHSVKSADRVALIKIVKELPLHVKELLGKDKAVVSAGGVSLTEIDFKTMESKIIKNLYVTGDMLNIDRPSGGYSLQLCWTTGYVAGSHC